MESRQAGINALQLVADERLRQIEKGFESGADSCFRLAAIAYIHQSGFKETEEIEFSIEADKCWPGTHSIDQKADCKACLVRAAALILAEIERLSK